MAVRKKAVEESILTTTAEAIGSTLGMLAKKVGLGGDVAPPVDPQGDDTKRPPARGRRPRLDSSKSVLVAGVTASLEIPPEESAVMVEVILDSIVKALRAGDKVEIRGFGTFGTRPRAARTGRNPRTGAPVEVPAKRIPFFKPSRELKNLVMGAEGAERG